MLESGWPFEPFVSKLSKLVPSKNCICPKKKMEPFSIGNAQQLTTVEFFINPLDPVSPFLRLMDVHAVFLHQTNHGKTSQCTVYSKSN